MTDLFLTGTWRNKWNKEFNLKLETALTAAGFSCFLPQRDTDQTASRKDIFLKDVAGIEHAKVLLAIGANKAQSANWGWEIGYAFKRGMPINILTDKDSDVELMPEGAAAKIFVPENIDDISSWINELVGMLNEFLK